MRVTITIDTDSPAFHTGDTAGTELGFVAGQAVALALMATSRLTHLPHDEIRALFDSDGVACGSVRVE